MNNREKLKLLIRHWMQHNEEHAKEFHEWAQKARDFGETSVYRDILDAVEQLEKVNEPLKRALETLSS